MKQIDRIRNMNAEEMAEFMCSIMSNDLCSKYCVYHNEDCYATSNYRCGEGIEAWLESEVEENGC